MTEKKLSLPETLFPELVNVAVVAVAVAEQEILDVAHLRKEIGPEWPILPHVRPAQPANRPRRGRHKRLEPPSAG